MLAMLTVQKDANLCPNVLVFAQVSLFAKALPILMSVKEWKLSNLKGSHSGTRGNKILLLHHLGNPTWNFESCLSSDSVHCTVFCSIITEHLLKGLSRLKIGMFFFQSNSFGLKWPVVNFHTFGGSNKAQISIFGVKYLRDPPITKGAYP